MNERVKFVAAAQSGRLSFKELCEDYGISRKTGYKIIERYERDGPKGPHDQSRAPRSHPNQTPMELEGAVLRVRKVSQLGVSDPPVVRASRSTLSSA